MYHASNTDLLTAARIAASTLETVVSEDSQNFAARLAAEGLRNHEENITKLIDGADNALTVLIEMLSDENMQHTAVDHLAAAIAHAKGE